MILISLSISIYPTVPDLPSPLPLKYKLPMSLRYPFYFSKTSSPQPLPTCRYRYTTYGDLTFLFYHVKHNTYKVVVKKNFPSEDPPKDGYSDGSLENGTPS